MKSLSVGVKVGFSMVNSRSKLATSFRCFCVGRKKEWDNENCRLVFAREFVCKVDSRLVSRYMNVTVLYTKAGQRDGWNLSELKKIVFTGLLIFFPRYNSQLPIAKLPFSFVSFDRV